MLHTELKYSDRRRRCCCRTRSTRLRLRVVIEVPVEPSGNATVAATQLIAAVGAANSTRLSGNSVSGQIVTETSVAEVDMPDHIREW